MAAERWTTMRGRTGSGRDLIARYSQHMSKDVDTDEYRTLLVDERSKLIERLTELGLTEDQRPTGTSVVDSSQVTSWRNEGRSTGEQLHDALHEVDQAIDRLDHGTYGICEGCHELISPARLEARPESRLCIKCASRGK
jgi:DnaK suppressor protein